MNAEPYPRLCEFSYAGGRWSDRVLPLLPVPRGKDRKGTICVLVDVEGRAVETAVERIRTALAEYYYRDPSGSLTSALVRSIQRVNLELFEENERSVRSDRQLATLCCAVLRDDEAYFAIAGRGVGFLICSDRGERFGSSGADLPRLRPELVGQAEAVNVDLHHRIIDRPTAIILSSDGLLELIGDHSADDLRGRPERVVDGLRAIGRHRQGGQPFRTLVILLGPDVPSTGVGIADDTEFQPTRVTSRPAPGQRRRPRQVSPLPAEPELLDGEETTDEERAAALSRRQIGFLAPPRLPELGLASLQPTRIVLALVVLFGLFFVGYVGVLITARILQGGAPYTQAMSELVQAQRRESEAMGQGDPLVRRHLLDEANQLVAKALSQRPNDPFTITAAARIQREYQAASGIVDLPSPTVVVTLPAPGDQMVLSGTELYVLDRTNSRLYKYLLGSDGAAVAAGVNPLLVQRGDRIGSATVGTLSQIAWAPALNGHPNGALLALDASGFLVEYDPADGLGTLLLRDPGAWGSVTAIASDGTRLYALDASQQTLGVFPSQADGFDGPVYNYFEATTTVNLADAVGIAVDGDLYLLHSSGQIQRFARGKPVPFAGPPSDLRPTRPAGLALGPTSLYIGDPLQGRVIQVGRDGTYRRALVAEANPGVLANLRDLAVSGGDRDLYVLSGDKVYRFPLP